VAPPTPSAALAFARYIASTQEADPLTDSGYVGLEIEATIPALYKTAKVLAVRGTSESERNVYQVLAAEGDAIVAQEIIARYFLMQDELDGLQSSSVTVTPENYKFRYKGAVGTGSSLAYVYEIRPRKKREGLIQGQLWIDSETGTAILETGRFVKSLASSPGNIDVVRNTELMEGDARVRVTHLTIETRYAGRGELTITEIPLVPAQKSLPEYLPLARK